MRHGREIDVESVVSEQNHYISEPTVECPYCSKGVRGGAIYAHMKSCRCQPKECPDSARSSLRQESKLAFDIQKYRVCVEALRCSEARKGLVERGDNLYRMGPFYALPKQSSKDLRASLRVFKEFKKAGMTASLIEMRVLKVAYVCPSKVDWQATPCVAEMTFGSSWTANSCGSSARNGEVCWSVSDIKGPNGWEIGPASLLVSKMVIKIRSLGAKEPLVQGVVALEGLLELMKLQSYGEDNAQEYTIFTDYSSEYAYSIGDYDHYESSYAGKLVVSVYLTNPTA